MKTCLALHGVGVIGKTRSEKCEKADIHYDRRVDLTDMSRCSPTKTKRKKLAEQAMMVFEEYGKEPFRVAKKAILDRNISEPISGVVEYFFSDVWRGGNYPVLTSLGCEAVGGEISNTTSIGAAFVLLAGGSDLHDDIIDKSRVKYSVPTVYGKFGEDLTLLAGDALLYRGLTLLGHSCEDLPPEKRRKILKLVETAFFKMGCAEAKESRFKGRQSLMTEKLLRMIDGKASVAEAAVKVGAILGNANLKQIRALGKYGRIVGILSTLRDDFVDICEPDEICNRLRNETLPLPLAYALKDKKRNRKLLSLLHKQTLTRSEGLKIAEIVLGSPKVRDLLDRMHRMGEEACKALRVAKIPTKHKLLELVINALLEDLV